MAHFEDINMAKLNYEKGTYGHWETLPSGLNGIVRLIPVKYLFDCLGWIDNYPAQFSLSRLR